MLLVQVLGNEQSTAQVHPEKLTKAMMAAAESRGAKVKIGTVEDVTISHEPSSHVTGQHHTVVPKLLRFWCDSTILGLHFWKFFNLVEL